MSAAVLTPFTARDGENLAVYDWPLEARGGEAGDNGGNVGSLRGVVLMVHGLGEHAMRYEHVAGCLMDWGFAVRAFDQRGHGESGGARGALPADSALVDDLAEVIDDTRQLCRRLQAAQVTPERAAPLPLILLGHSLGALVAARLVAQAMRPVEALVLSSPALDVGFGAFQKLVLALLHRLAPNLGLRSGLKLRYLCRDASVVQRYAADRLVHKRISPRLARFIASAGPAVLAAASQWRTSTLLMYGGADRLVRPSACRTFAAKAMGSVAVEPGTVTEKCFDRLYHEIFNELEASPVFDALESWLDAQFPSKTAASPQQASAVSYGIHSAALAA